MSEAERENKITDGRNHFTMIPNVILEMGLTSGAIALYLALKRSAGEEGECTRSTATLAKNCGLSTGSVCRAKKELVERGLITITEHPSRRGRPAHHITICPIWSENERYFAENAGINSPAEVISSPAEVISSTGEMSKNLLVRTNEEELRADESKTDSPGGDSPKHTTWDDVIGTPHPSDTPSLLSADTPEALEMFAVVAEEDRARGHTVRRQFPSKSCKRKFLSYAGRLNGNTRSLTEQAFANCGYLSIPRLVNYLAKCTGERREVDNQGEHDDSQRFG